MHKYICLKVRLILAILGLSSSIAFASETASTAFSSHSGVIEQAPYRIDLPNKWNGDLVMYLHGYEPKGMPRAPEIPPNDFDRWLLSKGYAVAQSQYATQGWAVAEALNDNERLRQKAISIIGKPRRTLLFGQSLGGHLVLATLERHPNDYSGAVALCGANASATDMFLDGVVGTLTVFDYYFPGAIPLAPDGLADTNSPPMFDPGVLELALQSNEDLAAALAERFEITRAELAGGILTRYVVLREMIERAGGFPVDNSHAIYAGFIDDAELNKGVRRYSGDPGAMAYTQKNATLLGTASKPVVMMANRTDPTVPGRISSRYAKLAEDTGHASNVLTLASIGDGHCAFTPDDVELAFTALITWLDNGKRP